MLHLPPQTIARGKDAPFTKDQLARAIYAPSGIFEEGRLAELDALRAMGRCDPSLGRLYEGHFNGALLIALYGTHAQRRRSFDELRCGSFYGVWNTQDDSNALEISKAGTRYLLRGAKTWASGADSVTRALVTARRADGRIQLCVVAMDRVRTVIDASRWQPLGMHASRSYDVAFDGVFLDEDDLVGEPDSYELDPWFFGGAIRFVAVHAGIIERLVLECFAYLAERGRDREPLQVARAADARIALASALNWVGAGERAWSEYDCEPTDDSARHVVDTVNMARLAVERAGLETLELVTRCIGARGLLEPLPFASLVRDLTMYLRQPAPDAVTSRVGTGAFMGASARRNAAIAETTGSSSYDT